MVRSRSPVQVWPSAHEVAKENTNCFVFVRVQRPDDAPKALGGGVAGLAKLEPVTESLSPSK